MAIDLPEGSPTLVVKGTEVVLAACIVIFGESAKVIMQDNHDLWQARQRVNLDAVEPIEFHVA